VPAPHGTPYTRCDGSHTRKDNESNDTPQMARTTRGSSLFTLRAGFCLIFLAKNVLLIDNMPGSAIKGATHSAILKRAVDPLCAWLLISARQTG
jgi:hypothetical protein